MPLRLLLVDDFDFVRVGLRSIFASRSDWQICGEAADGVTAIAKVVELTPDIVILDMTMPVMNGFEAAKEIRRLAPSTKIILFSVYDIPVDGLPADAFVSKSSGADGLISTIERLAASITPSSEPSKTQAKARPA
jgi:DNA-binding NarL/FixJ family response regulator